jgi:hypothetical protein
MKAKRAPSGPSIAQRLAQARYDVEHHDAALKAQWSLDGCDVSSIMTRCWAVHEQRRLREQARQTVRELEAQLAAANDNGRET